MPVVATLCHIIKGRQFLLQKKSKGLFGGGKWNGVGGRTKLNESPEECVKREVFEETGLRVLDLKFHGILNFYFGDRGELDWVVHVFSTTNFEGEPKPSEEGNLKWFDFEEIPYGEMWGDDKYWIPLLFKGHRFRGNFYFDEKGEKLLDFNLDVEKKLGKEIPQGEAMRVLACSDLHGDIAALKKILKNAERMADTDIIVMAGDLTAFPKKSEIRIRSVEKTLTKFFNVNKNDIAQCRDKNIVVTFERIKFCYDFPEDLAKQLTPNKIRDFGEFGLLKESKIFQDYQSKQLVHILQLLDKCKIPSLIVIGNDDHPSLGKLMSEAEKKHSNFTNIDKKIASHQGHFFFGYGGAARKDVGCLNDWEERACREEMSKFTDRLRSLDPLVFVSHCPPHGCLDLAPYRPTMTSPTPTLRCFSLTPLKRGGRHIGSHALRETIQETQPRYFVCGHSHRNGGKTEKIGKTTVVNVATARVHPRFGGRYAIIDTEKDLVDWFKITK